MLEVYFESYGCTANQNSTEIMKGLVKQAGLNITSNPDIAAVMAKTICPPYLGASAGAVAVDLAVGVSVPCSPAGFWP